MNPIILVDVDPDTRWRLAAMLEECSHPVLSFSGWREARAGMVGRTPSVVVLTDWRRTGGRWAYRYLRHAARGAAFVMVCHGGVTDWDDRFAQVMHYPLMPDELRRALRAATAMTGAVTAGGDLRLDPRARTLSWKGRSIGLTPLQTGLMQELMSAGGCMTAEELLQAVWGDGPGQDRRMLYTHLSWLRTRLAGLDGIVSIESVPRRRYRLVVHPAESASHARAGG